MKIRMSGRGDVAINPKTIEQLNHQYGLDRPLYVRFGKWLARLSHFDLGESSRYHEPVSEIIAERFPISITFGVGTFLITYLVSIPLGIYQALWPRSIFGSIGNFFMFTAFAAPPVVIGFFLIVMFAVKIPIFPIGGFQSDDYESLSFFALLIDRAYHMVLPLVCYVIGGFAQIAVLTRNSFLDVLKLDYIRTARAKGLSEWSIYFKHVLRNAAIPLVVGLSGFVGLFLSGSLFVESIFDLNGLGLLAYESAIGRDYNILLALCLLGSLALTFSRILGDLLYTWLDPRIDLR